MLIKPKKIEQIKKIALHIIQLRLFKKSAIINKIFNSKDTDYSKGTIRNYVTYGVSYLRNGKNKKNLNATSKLFYDFLDKFKEQNIEALQPEFTEKSYLYRTDKEKRANKEDASKYAIKDGDIIKICTSFKAALQLSKDLKTFGHKKIKLIKIKYFFLTIDDYLENDKGITEEA